MGCGPRIGPIAGRRRPAGRQKIGTRNPLQLPSREEGVALSGPVIKTVLGTPPAHQNVGKYSPLSGRTPFSPLCTCFRFRGGGQVAEWPESGQPGIHALPPRKKIARWAGRFGPSTWASRRRLAMPATPLRGLLGQAASDRCRRHGLRPHRSPRSVLRRIVGQSGPCGRGVCRTRSKPPANTNGRRTGMGVHVREGPEQ